MFAETPIKNTKTKYRHTENNMNLLIKNALRQNGRLIGVTIDPETLDPYFEGKKAKFGLTNKILNIK